MTASPVEPREVEPLSATDAEWIIDCKGLSNTQRAALAAIRDGQHVVISAARLAALESIEREQSCAAARYRWLRERDLDTISRGGVFAGMTPKNVVLNGDDLDAAIDAALAQNVPEPKP